jgi:hypothetical protein
MNKFLDIEGLCPSGTWARLFRMALVDEITVSDAEEAMDRLSNSFKAMTSPALLGDEKLSVTFNPSAFLAIRCSLVGF